ERLTWPNRTGRAAYPTGGWGEATTASGSARPQSRSPGSCAFLRLQFVSGVLQLLVPTGPSLPDQVEQIPDRLERAATPRILPGVGGRVEQLGGPEVGDRRAIPVEDIQHRSLRALGGLGVVVAVVRVFPGGEQPQPPPAAFLGEGEHSRQRGLRDDREV